MTRSGSGRGKRGGFTLIEIAAVVLLLALMMTTVTVRLDSYLPSTRSEAAARSFLSTLDLARTSAVAHGAVYEVEIELDDGAYRIVTPFDEEGRAARDRQRRTALNWEELPDGVRFGGIWDNSGRLIEEGVYRLRFDQLGSAQELLIYFENDALERFVLTVRVLALTGASKVIVGRQEPRVLSDDDF